jgi:hypothetical protein
MEQLKGAVAAVAPTDPVSWIKLLAWSGGCVLALQAEFWGVYMVATAVYLMWTNLGKTACLSLGYRTPHFQEQKTRGN